VSVRKSRKKSRPRQRLRTMLIADAEKMFGEPDIKRLLTQFTVSGLSPANIASKYDISPVSVRTWFRKLQVKTESGDRSATKRLIEAGYATWDEFFRKNLAKSNRQQSEAVGIHFSTLSIYRRLWQVSGGKI
jgi:transposase-like protein